MAAEGVALTTNQLVLAVLALVLTQFAKPIILKFIEALMKKGNGQISPARALALTAEHERTAGEKSVEFWELRGRAIVEEAQKPLLAEMERQTDVLEKIYAALSGRKA